MSSFRGPNAREIFKLLARRNLGAGVPPPGPIRIIVPKTTAEGPANGPPAQALPPLEYLSVGTIYQEPASSGVVFEVNQYLPPTGAEHGPATDSLQMMVVDCTDPGQGENPPVEADPSDEYATVLASPALQLAVWELYYDRVDEVPESAEGEEPDDDPGPLSLGQTATVAFWTGDKGQALVRRFNGGPLASAMGTWFAESFPNLHGPASAHDLTSKANSYLAAFLRRLGRAHGSEADSQVFATALAVYATTEALGGRVAEADGFRVTKLGVGACCCNVGASGAAFGVQNGSTLTILQLLRALDQRSTYGVLLGADPNLVSQARRLFDLVNQFGDVNG